MPVRFKFPIPKVLAAVACLIAAAVSPGDLQAQYDYGWRNSTNAGGAAPGEAGGTIRRGSDQFISFYADRLLGGPLTFEDPLTASGKVDFENNQGFDGDIFLGFFNPIDIGFGGTNSPNNLVGLQIREAGGGFMAHRVFGAVFDGVQEYATNYVSTQTDGINNFDQDYDFEIDYDPAGGANGRLTVDMLVGGVSALSAGALVYDLTPEERANGATFNAFGIYQGENSDNLGQRVDMFIDDLEYTRVGGVETQTFDSEESARAAGWIALNTLDPLPSAPPLLPPPDVNQDTNIDLLDFAEIRDNFLTGTTFEQGDVNFDGTVNLVDFAIWKAAAFPPGGGAAAVPEPGSLALLLAAAVWGARARRRRDVV